MSSLQFTERNLLEKILGMRTGYVSDFSDRTFQEFVLEKTGIDILTEPYAEGGTSKANRLRTFWKKESDATVVALVEPLLEYALREKIEFDRQLNGRDEHSFIEARKIIQRLKAEPAATVSEVPNSDIKSEGHKFTPPNRFLEIILNIFLVQIYLLLQFVKDVAKYAYQHLVQVLGVALAVVILHLMGVI